MHAMLHGVDKPEPDRADKGLEGGSCNRQACQAPGATWFNHYTNRWYCGDCARLINRGNPEGWPIGSGKPAVVERAALLCAAA